MNPKTIRACFKNPGVRRVAARGLHKPMESTPPCRPAALTGRLLKHALMWKTRRFGKTAATLLFYLAIQYGLVSSAPSDEVRTLAEEVKEVGWIAYGARSEKGDWDLFLCRPDGSSSRPLTRTSEFNEFSPQFSRDGQRLLYRRIPRGETIDNNHHGTQGELVLARSDGSEPIVFGHAGEYPWASWNPDATQIACLSIKGISLIEVGSRKVARSLPRKGFFQQLVWSPAGPWLAGVANAYGASWSIARMNAATGEAGAVNRVDCCTPDWFPDSRQIIFSWRPPGQKANNGYGWTQLWMADAAGQSRKLVYGEEGRHVYGGHVSPDGRYVLFTGNMQEDGDPGNAGAPMGLMRLADAPIIGGESRELRAQHPHTKDGPVLNLPAGWEPCWTFATPGANPSDRTDHPDDVARLKVELHAHGWLIFSAKTEAGDWDLFLMRPDGSDRKQLTHTPAFNEVGARLSPEGTRLLYYRQSKDEPVDNNTYGEHELVLADATGLNPESLGTELPWASWGPDSQQLACLKPRGIEIIDLETRSVLRRLPRQGLVEQLVWSPDGRFFVGTANGLGPYWTIGCIDVTTGEIHAVSETDRYNCTPAWYPNSQHVLYSRGIIPEKGGKAELWLASAQSKEARPLYAETGRHIYGACASPDGEYLLFTRSVEDLGEVDKSQTTMAIIRWRDTPMIGDEAPALRRRMPQASRGPRLDLGFGWEPHWTLKEIAK